MRIALIDPSMYTAEIPSPNIGDQIISRASVRELRGVFGRDVQIRHIPSHSKISRDSYKALKVSDHIVVGGSNLLWFRYWPRASWPLGLKELFFLRNVVLMGVGWGSYSIRAKFYSRLASNMVLSHSELHSVRDSYTASIVAERLGLPNVVNTGCHTTWFLSDGGYSPISGIKSKCIFSLTDYDKNVVRDSAMLSQLQKVYGDANLVFWPQGKGDSAYVKSLGFNGLVIERSLEAFMSYLDPDVYDYVGTRLHAGILAIEFGLRCLIVAIDNRAIEIARDTGLPVLEGQNVGELEAMITSDFDRNVSITVNKAAIQAWRAQFL